MNTILIPVTRELLPEEDLKPETVSLLKKSGDKVFKVGDSTYTYVREYKKKDYEKLFGKGQIRVAEKISETVWRKKVRGIEPISSR